MELSHEIDLLNYLFSTPRVVFSQNGKYSNLSIDVEDNAVVLFDFYDCHKILGKLEMSMSSVRNQRNILVQYDQETLELNLLTENISIYNTYKQEQDISLPSGGKDYTYLQQLKDISVRMANGERPNCSIYEGNEVLEFIENIKNFKIGVNN